VNCEIRSARPPNTAQINARFKPKSRPSPRPKSAPNFLPPANATSPIKTPITSSAVHIAASFSSATRNLGRGSERSTSMEPRSSSPRSIRLPARSGQIAIRKMKMPILNVA